MTSRKKLLLAVAGLLTIGGIAAAAAGHLWVAVSANLVVVLFALMLQIAALNREELRYRRMERLEDKLDIATRRFVTESEAIAEQLSTQVSETQNKIQGAT